MANNNEEKTTKKVGRAAIIFWAIMAVVWIVGGGLFMKSIQVNNYNNTTLVRQFGDTKRAVTEVGPFFVNPITQNTISIFTGERLYDIPVTNVTTSDKKTMEADAFVTWQITDAPLYYKQLSSVDAATGRISSNVYSSLKKVISATSQDDVIAGKDGSLSDNILNSVSSLDNYGIKLCSFDIKGLDLPNENKESVYARMISERQAIEAQYKADGEKKYNTEKASTDAEVRTLKSNAEADAATILADAETQYFKIIKAAYSGSPEKEAFYQYYIGLEALKESLANGGTYQITPESPLYKILVNAQ